MALKFRRMRLLVLGTSAGMLRRCPCPLVYADIHILDVGSGRWSGFGGGGCLQARVEGPMGIYKGAPQKFNI